jgi:hypothetical protein
VATRQRRRGGGVQPDSLFAFRPLNVWDEPLSDNEREIIGLVLATGSGNDARRWLRHLLKVYDAREASRG